MDADPKRSLPFDGKFHRARRRLRRRAVLRTSAMLLPWLLLAGLVALVAERLGVVALPGPATVAVLAAVLAGGAGWAALRSPRGCDAALVLDRRLGTRELVTAAHESAAATAGDRHPFHEVVRGRAAAALEAPAVARALPLTAWRRWRPAFFGLVALLLAGLLPPLGERAAASLTQPDAVVEAAAEALAEELAPLADQAAALERPEAAEALGRLQQMVDDLRSGELATAEQALVALNKTEDVLASLRQELSPGGLDELIDDMAAAPLSSDLAKAMSELDREALRDALRRMADAVPSAEARSAALDREIKRLAGSFQELAEALEQIGGRDLAETLHELAAALESGDAKRAEMLLKSDRVAMALEMAAKLGKGEGLGDDMAELLQLTRYLLGKKNPEAMQPGCCAPEKLGEGGDHRPGTTSTNEEGESFTTGAPILRDRRTEETSERRGEFEALYDSLLADGESFEDLLAAGKVGDEGEMLSEEGRALGVDGGASLPLRPFGGAASGGAERAVDLESVPIGYRDLVRDYFGRNTVGRNPDSGRKERRDPDKGGEQ